LAPFQRGYRRLEVIEHLQRRQPVEQVGRLRHVGDFRPNVGRQVGDVFAVDGDRSGLGLAQAQHAFEQGRLAGAVAAQQADHLARQDLPVQLVEHRFAGEVFRDRRNLDDRSAHDASFII
jgi:hypothetical protein